MCECNLELYLNLLLGAGIIVFLWFVCSDPWQKVARRLLSCCFLILWFHTYMFFDRRWYIERWGKAARILIRYANLPTKIIPTKICWLNISGKFPMCLGIPPLQIKIMLESNPLKSRILVWRLAVHSEGQGLERRGQAIAAKGSGALLRPQSERHDSKRIGQTLETPQTRIPQVRGTLATVLRDWTWDEHFNCFWCLVVLQLWGVQNASPGDVFCFAWVATPGGEHVPPRAVISACAPCNYPCSASHSHLS